MAAAVRRFAVLAVVVAAIVAGVLVSAFHAHVTGTGWTVYAPLLILLGAVLIAGWIGCAAGRRRPRP